MTLSCNAILSSPFRSGASVMTEPASLLVSFRRLLCSWSTFDPLSHAVIPGRLPSRQVFSVGALSRNHLRAPRESAAHSVPRQGRTLNPDRKLGDTGKNRQLAQGR